MLCVVLYYKANLFHFSLLDGKEYFFVFSTKISSLLIVMEARNLFCYLHISRISTISSAVSCLQQPGVMKMKKAAHGWTPKIEKRDSGGRCWQFSGGLPKFLFVNGNQESVPSMIRIPRQSLRLPLNTFSFPCVCIN